MSVRLTVPGVSSSAYVYEEGTRGPVWDPGYAVNSRVGDSNVGAPPPPLPLVDARDAGVVSAVWIYDVRVSRERSLR
jgi:hypothetical protein